MLKKERPPPLGRKETAQSERKVPRVLYLSTRGPLYVCVDLAVSTSAGPTGHRRWIRSRCDAPCLTETQRHTHHLSPG